MRANDILGTVSAGTMAEADLVERFSSWLDGILDDVASHCTGDHDPRPFVEWRSAADDILGRLERGDEYAGADAEQTLWGLLEEIPGLIGADYIYFGAHVDDGADYGFWIDHEALQDAVHDGDVVQSSDGGSVEGRTTLIISDHGNMTLIGADGSEVWSVV